MVELMEDGLHRAREVGEVAHPPGVITNWSDDVHRDSERVAVQARTLVTGRNVRKAMRRLEGELLEDLHRDDTLPVEQAARFRHATVVVGRGRREDETVCADRGKPVACRRVSDEPPFVESGMDRDQEPFG